MELTGGPTANARELLAKRLEKADRWPEARVLREEVLAARRRNLGADDEGTLSAERWLARSLAHDRIDEEAVALADHVVAHSVDNQLITFAGAGDCLNRRNWSIWH